MATKKCMNGHLYDSAIYGDNCPFCPSAGGETTFIGSEGNGGSKTRVVGGTEYDEQSTGPEPFLRTTGTTGTTGPTIPMGGNGAGGGPTVIRRPGAGGPGGDNTQGRKLVGLLVSYSANPNGEVYKIYEGRTTIGRDLTCDIPFPSDTSMSSKHFLIQYVGAKGAFRGQEFDQGSANGSYVNGQVYVLGDVVDLKANDVIVIGTTKFVFLPIPQF